MATVEMGPCHARPGPGLQRVPGAEQHLVPGAPRPWREREAGWGGCARCGEIMLGMWFGVSTNKIKKGLFLRPN